MYEAFYFNQKSLSHLTMFLFLNFKKNYLQMETMKYSELSNELLCTPETNKKVKLKINKLLTKV